MRRPSLFRRHEPAVDLSPRPFFPIEPRADGADEWIRPPLRLQPPAASAPDRRSIDPEPHPAVTWLSLSRSTRP
jgi:hypothetical protein